MVGGRSKNGSVIGNSVTISGGDISGQTDVAFAYGGIVTGGWVSGGNSATAEGNVVTVTGGTIDTFIVGGSIGLGATGIAKNNSVHIKGGSVKHEVYGGRNAGSGPVNNNTVTIDSGVTVNSNVIGGESNGGLVSENTVTVFGTVIGNVYGGKVSSSGSGQIGQAINNTIELRGNAEITETASAQWDDSGSSGRVLVSGTTSVGNLTIFDEIEFQLVNDNTSKAALTITQTGKTLYLDSSKVTIDGSQLSNNTSRVYLVSFTHSGTVALNRSTQFIDKASTFVDKTWNISGSLFTQGSDVARLTSNSIYLEDGQILSEDTTLAEGIAITDKQILSPNENSKTLSESLLGTVAFLNQGAEFIADEALTAMVNSAELGEISAFGAVHGGTSNYKTGSRVDVDGYTLATGASLKVTPDWIVGGFIEAGWADSDSHVEGTKGKGDHDYYGLGLATRYMVNKAWYVDGSFRIGQASTEFNGVYAADSAKYDSDAFYVTAHAGTGYVFSLTDTTNLDVYGRYLVTYLDGDDVSLHNKYDDKLDMETTVTHAVRAGARLTGAFCPYAGWKLGLAYEHVFDGDAESAVNSLNLEVPSLEGDTGIMEVGVTMKPSLNSRWSMALGAKGYIGDREGVTGNVLIRYAF